MKYDPKSINGNLLGRMIPLLLIFFIIIYAAYQTFRFFFSGYSTENAYIFEVSRVHTTAGLLIRDEKPIEQSYDGAIRYMLPEGGKFISTTPVAYRYSDETAADYAQQCKKLEQERMVLSKAGKLSSTKPDIAKLSESIYSALRDHSDYTVVNRAGYPEKTRLKLLEGITGIKAAVDDRTDFSERAVQLSDEISKAEQGQPITVNDAGYFSRYADGWETEFSTELLETLTLQQLDDYLEQDYPPREDLFGKVISDYNWYYVTSIPSTEANAFQPDTRLNLTFISNRDAEQVTGWVESITDDYALGRSLLVIKSNDINEDTVSHRTATVRLGFEDYRGIRFSKRALRIQNGVKGVYVRGNSSIKFKQVDITYTGSDFYLSRVDYNSETFLNIFDEIIVEGTNLYDGKPLE